MNNINIFFVENNIAHARSLEQIKKINEIRICLAGSGHEYYKKMGMVFAEWRKKKLDFVTLYPSRMVVLVHNDEQGCISSRTDFGSRMGFL